MNKDELVHRIAVNLKVTQVDAKKIVTAVIETIETTVANGEKVTLQGFGIFKLKHRAERTARLISEDKAIRIPATIIPVFIPSKNFKEQVENTPKIEFPHLNKKSRNSRKPTVSH